MKITNQHVDDLLKFIDQADHVVAEDVATEAVNIFPDSKENVDVVLSLLHTDHESGDIYEFEFTRGALKRAKIAGNEIVVEDIHGELCLIVLSQFTDLDIPKDLAKAFSGEDEE